MIEESSQGVWTPSDQRAMVAVAAQFFVNGALFASFVPRLPEIRDALGVSLDRVGLLLSIGAAAGLIGSAVVSPIISRFGTRSVMLASSAVVSVSLLLVGQASTQAMLLVGLMGMLGFDVLVDVAMNMQGSWLSARRRVPIMNRLHGLWSLGAVAGGASSSRIAAAGVSLDVHLALAGAVLLVVLVFVSRGLLRVDEIHQASPGGDGAQQTTELGRLIPTLLLFGLAGLFALAIESTSTDWAAFRLTDDFGAGPGSAILGYVAVTVGMTVGRFGGDWASVRLGQQRLLLFASTLAAIGLAIATLVDQQYVSLAGYLIAGTGMATMLPSIYDQAAKNGGRAGTGLGALTAGLRVSSLTVPLLVGSLAETPLSVGASIAIVTLPSAVGFILATLLLRDH